jgi:hypothetical protein
MSRYPKEALVFRDRDCRFTDLYEATDINADELGLTCRLHHEVLSASGAVHGWATFDGGWVDWDFVIPLTPAAREFLAIARAAELAKAKKARRRVA